jgi:glycerol-1-phosphate dehydrogenase [NAD(P)+]
MHLIPHLPTVIQQRWSDVEEHRPALIVTSTVAWQAVSWHFAGIRHRHPIMCTEATQATWDAIPTHDCAVIYAIGGGLAVDTAKYLAHQHQLPLICVPTALTVDAFFTPASGIRRDGCVSYIPTKAPDTLILDIDLLAAAPPHLRAAGITDVLSIATGAWDWRFAAEHERNPPNMPYLAWADDVAQSILRQALACAATAGRGDRGGLKTLQLCHQIGHSRPEEGSEHYFAYAVENSVGHGLPHGDLVAPGILIMAERQGQETRALRQALVDCHVPLNTITTATIQATLATLPAYCRQHDLPFGIAHTL